MERKKGEKDKKEGEGELHGREKGKKEEKRKGRKKKKRRKRGSATWRSRKGEVIMLLLGC